MASFLPPNPFVIVLAGTGQQGPLLGILSLDPLVKATGRDLHGRKTGKARGVTLTLIQKTCREWKGSPGICRQGQQHLEGHPEVDRAKRVSLEQAGGLPG